MKEDAVLVIADDFTGANDVGVQFNQHALSARVLLNTYSAEAGHDGNHLIVNSDSRSLNASDAAERVARLIQITRKDCDSRWVFKKIDSTLRGNIGAEIEAVLQSAKIKLAIISSAYPSAGRVIHDGQCYVHDRLITDTEFATDPKTPVLAPDIKTIVAAQSTLPVTVFSVEQIQSSDIRERLNALAHNGMHIVVADALTDSDLQRIADVALSLDEKPLLVGSAGLAGAFVRQLKRASVQQPRPLLSMIGTMSEMTQAQIEYAREQCDIEVIELSVGDLLTQPEQKLLDAFVFSALSVLKLQRHCVIKTRCTPEARHEVSELCRIHALSRHALGNKISHFMGRLTTAIVNSHIPLGGLFLSGGDIATAVAAAFNADFFEIKGQVGGCVPWGVLSGSSINHIPVMTKAGGFGQKHTFLEVINFVEEKACE